MTLHQWVDAKPPRRNTPRQIQLTDNYFFIRMMLPISACKQLGLPAKKSCCIQILKHLSSKFKLLKPGKWHYQQI